ncbi:MAG: acetate--CoA ligase family protein [Nitrososphaerota archaeon]|nr:acetate--CoA ligase family protein [Candidatus Bathyarchaeota archaeon]MDW8048288.1 acetate--CoA ligase family protein [Nitrososphaerota archaeon]
MVLEAFFKPRSIAVIGASREPTKVGHKVFKNLLDSGFPGDVFPINPQADQILGVKCYPDVNSVPSEVDLAVIAVPAKIVPIVAEQCGQKGVRGITVLSAGFSETGKEGAMLERNLVDICRRYGMRLQGPNCLGIINVRGRMNASFAAANPLPGRIAFVSQSGALGSAILNLAIQKDIGFTSFVSLGNEADLTAADFLEELANDNETNVIGLYIEGIKDGERFINVAKEATKRKPVVALKAGTTEVGIRAVSSHTGSLAGSDTAFTEVFRKTSIIRVNTLEELFNVVIAFGEQPLPKGKRTLIITNGGGPGILAADMCERIGLELPLLEYDIREELRKSLPPHASLNNPIDILGDADETRYKVALEAGLKSEVIDGIIVILTPQAMTPCERVSEVLSEIRKKSSKPILASFMGLDDDSIAIKTLQKSGVPNYSFPESAAYALKRMCDYVSALKRQENNIPVFNDVDDEKIKEIITKVKSSDRLSLTVDEAFEVAEAYRIPIPKGAIARNRTEAVDIANSIGYPVAMKIVSPEILHKTDVGGVILNVNSSFEVDRHFDELLRRASQLIPQAKISGILIQEMVQQGKEVIVGAIRDRQFGPLIMFGLGGIYVNFLRDVSYRLCPITRSEAKEMIEETKAYTLLRGVRGESPSDIDSLIEVILKVSQIMYRFPEIVEMEINPLFVYREGEGCTAIDIRATIKK